ncbi:hypothetical protein PR202_ga13542 [Eleusine coracana subsp. coracana]|uniref:Uncharacterized protein n=1 Tax=Eleusine coracana subsp. coracana TaxID=191504 RepID=A0AAV5CEZ8_ELECO|nr:hypothetical protein PR202_ga13542 [Eleusine coracana subsp. coracana]
MMGNENMILCSDCAGHTSLYDADSHSVVTVPDLGVYKGRDSIPFCIASGDKNHATDNGRYAGCLTLTAEIAALRCSSSMVVRMFSVHISCSVVGNWRLPFYGRAEHVPGLDLWFGLSASRPFHLCAFDLSTVDFDQPPAVLDTWVDLDMPKSWSPYQLDLIHLSAGRFCVVKIFHSTEPPIEMGFSDQEDDARALGDLGVCCLNWHRGGARALRW